MAAHGTHALLVAGCVLLLLGGSAQHSVISQFDTPPQFCRRSVCLCVCDCVCVLQQLDTPPHFPAGGYIIGYERSMWPEDVRVTPGKGRGDGRGTVYMMHYPKVQVGGLVGW